MKNESLLSHSCRRRFCKGQPHPLPIFSLSPFHQCRWTGKPQAEPALLEEAGSEQQNCNKILRAWKNLNKILNMKTESHKLRSSHCTRAQSRQGPCGNQKERRWELTDPWCCCHPGIPRGSLRSQDSANFILTSVFSKAEIKATLWRLYRHQYQV